MVRNAVQSQTPAKAEIIVPEIKTGTTYASLVSAIEELLEHAQNKIATTANTTLVETYWRTGRYAVEGIRREMIGYETFSWLYAAAAIAAPDRLPALELSFRKAWERTVVMFRQRNPGKNL